MALQRAFTTNDRQDEALASDGVSRYGAYLRQRSHTFRHDGQDCPPTTDPVRFVITAWTIASSPIMAPAYVTPHPRIQDVTVHWDDDHRAALAVQIAVAAPAAANHLPSPWRGWIHHHEPQRWFDPYDNDSVTVLTTLTVRLPLNPTRLPAPQYRSGAPDTIVAKHAVAAVCRDLNAELNDVLTVLDTPRNPTRIARAHPNRRRQSEATIHIGQPPGSTA